MNLLSHARTNPQRNVLYYIRVGLLWIGCMMLFLFFASGYYADAIRTANEYVYLFSCVRFVPQANRSLHTFNMHLHMPRSSWMGSWRMPWSSPSLNGGDASGETRACHGPFSDGRRPRSIFPHHGTPTTSPPPNERGELIFSSRVDHDFREGYERYRNAFERKRHEKIKAQQRHQPALWDSWPFFKK